MRLLVQPEGVGICGQSAMAMVLDVPVSDVVRVLPTINGTTAPQRRNVFLSYYGNKVSKVIEQNRVDNRKTLDFSGRGVVSIRTTRGRKHGHAMAFEDGKIYDPGGTIFINYRAMLAHYNEAWGKGNVRIGQITWIELHEDNEEKFMAAGETL